MPEKKGRKNSKIWRMFTCYALAVMLTGMLAVLSNSLYKQLLY